MKKEKRTMSDQQQVYQARPDYEEKLIQIIQGNSSPKVMKEQIMDFHENDIAAIMEDLNLSERKKLYRILDTQFISDVFSYLDSGEKYLDELNIRTAVEVIKSMDADDAVNILQRLDKTKKEIILDLLDEDSKKDIILIAAYKEDEIGSRMTTNFIRIGQGLTAAQALDTLIVQAKHNDNIMTIYVTDENQTFYGAVDLKELITAGKEADVEELISTSYPYVYASETIEECIERLKDYSEDSIPVLDNENKMLGVVTSQNLVEIIEDEMGEDYAKLAGLTAEEDLKEPLKDSLKKRVPWLIVLLGLGLVVSSVVGVFEAVVSQLTLIVCFQSLILDMAGNVGTQSLAVTIRVLMDENLTGKQKMELIWKEVRVGFCNGLLLGTISFVLIGGYIWLLKAKPFSFSYLISGCIGIALLIAMVVSSFTGTIIPILFKKIKIDPAVASGPLITTINDLAAVITYYGLAWLLLLQAVHIAA